MLSTRCDLVSRDPQRRAHVVKESASIVQLDRRGELRDPPIIHHQDPVPAKDGAKTMRNTDQGAISKLFGNRLLDLRIRFEIDRRCCFIKEDDLGLSSVSDFKNSPF